MATIDYTTLSLADVRIGLEAVARETDATFGGLSAGQLNWKPAATVWSVAQCFDHLVTANRLMLQAADDALAGRARTLWQRVPIVPGVLGRTLVRSQAPTTVRKFNAPAKSRPAASEIGPGIIPAFIAQQDDAVTRLQTLDDVRAARVIMTSPFVRIVTYSVADGWRLLLAHNRRHFEQARNVTASPGFPPS
jgi:hypothetical protein